MKRLTLTIEVPDNDAEMEEAILGAFAETCIPPSLRGYTFRMEATPVREVTPAQMPSWDEIAVSHERGIGEHPGGNVVALFPPIKPKTVA